MKKIVDDIRSYVTFLEQCGYKISFSFLKDQFAPVTHELIQYDFHSHAVCSFLKHNPCTEGRCIMNKRKLEQRGVTKPYYGCCYAGVEEFLFPVFYDDMMLICISVSGYRGKMEESHRRMEKLLDICGEKYGLLYGELSTDVPDFEYVSGFVTPLKYMLTELYRKCVVACEEENTRSSYASLYVKALHFISDNYSMPISCDTIAKELKYSPSYIRYIFKREGNVSVQAKINEIRLNKAKSLLRGGMMSITDIAFAVGFTDSNYFSTVFKKIEKISPSEYRKKLSR